jgi:protein-S-isoprenylcysteine O-methyltransferase Ste14
MSDMRASRAAVGSVAFFLVVPGLVAGVVPWLIGRSTAHELPWPWQMLGLLVAAAGLLALLACFVDFVAARGTPAPVAPTEQLVVKGLYRHVRNPMYVAVITIILGQSLWHGSPWLVAYGALVWALTASFVRFYEEPALRARFGSEYETYLMAVPAWMPRVESWAPGRGPAARSGERETPPPPGL